MNHREQLDTLIDLLQELFEAGTFYPSAIEQNEHQYDFENWQSRVMAVINASIKQTELFLSHVEFPSTGEVYNTKVILSDGSQLRGIQQVSQNSEMPDKYQNISLTAVCKRSTEE